MSVCIIEVMNMQLFSTRSDALSVDALSAVIAGISPEGGLYVPKTFPKLDDLNNYLNLTYPELCAKVLHLYFDELTYDELLGITKEGYATFSHPDVCPLKKLGDKEYVLELMCGPTIAFKDMALQVLPRLLYLAKQKKGITEKTLVLVATSGDTGKAALEGFAGVDLCDIAVFFPNEGVSALQKLQMVTQTGLNTYVSSVDGNFDDAQTGVKNIFGNEAFKGTLREKNIALSSANSINFGRLAPQIAYYVSAYVNLLKSGAISKGENVNFTVPTGNFGNILAAYYAKKMGLPVGKLICASNQNNVLTDFFNTGTYVSKRTFHKTISPSMDILISSNLERLLFELFGQDSNKIAQLMNSLKEQGAYEIGDDIVKLKEEFYAAYADEEQTKAAIKSTFEKHGYLLDPHTAVAKHVADGCADKTVNVIVATASPYKFCADVLNALNLPVPEDVFEGAKLLSEKTGTQIPNSVMGLKDKEIRHKSNVAVSGMLGFVEGIVHGR